MPARMRSCSGIAEWFFAGGSSSDTAVLTPTRRGVDPVVSHAEAQRAHYASTAAVDELCAPAAPTVDVDMSLERPTCELQPNLAPGSHFAVSLVGADAICAQTATTGPLSTQV